MEALRQRWKAWSMRLDALSFRERILVFVAVAGLALSLVFAGLIEPALRQQEQMLSSVSGLQQEIFSLREQLMQGEALNQSGMNTELGRLQAQAANLEQQAKTRESRLIPPEKMIAAIKTLLTAQPELTLISLETGPPRPALAEPASDTGGASDQAAAPPAPAAESLYRHGVTLRLQGSYAQLTDYVARLENLPWTVQWESVRLDAHQYPRIVLTLKLNTLSREPTWARL